MNENEKKIETAEEQKNKIRQRYKGIDADEGISGTSLKHRDAFLKMIQDCKAGKLDMILTKSVSRFARNIVDCIYYQRELKSLNPPVGILFETEGIYTLNANSEMSLSFIARDKLGCNIKSRFAASFIDFASATVITYFNCVNVI